MDLIGTEIVVSGHYAQTIEDPLESTLFRALIAQPSPGEFVEKVFAFPTKSITANTVSYTHLTLPTIYSV